MYDPGDVPPDPATAARSHGLRYVSDAKPGITRKRRGKRFHYFDAKGERIADPETIARLDKLAIPPAWTEVWICPHANGHIQATGKDAKGRKQYRYHDGWREWRDSDKFSHVLAFGEALPQIRAQVQAHMSERGLTRNKVLATVVALLDKTLIRVGNGEYSRTNGSYGLTTLKDEHVAVSGGSVRFRFKGKSGKEWNLKLSDRRIARVVKSCADIEGQELFKYVDDAGEVRDVTSGDVNAYLKEITGQDFTAKDFRTWAATVLAAVALRDSEPGETQTQIKRNIKQAIEQVSGRLGNTPAICRKSYVHPEVVKAYADGTMGDITLPVDTELEQAEQCVLAFLRQRLS